jgi:hypothetical protein
MVEGTIAALKAIFGMTMSQTLLLSTVLKAR